MSGLICENWIQMSGFVLRRLRYLVVVAVYAENLASHKQMVTKEVVLLLFDSDLQNFYLSNLAKIQRMNCC